MKGITKLTDKMQKISNIWRNGGTVALLQIGQDTDNYEAALNEQAIIGAIGLENLTNINRATAYGSMKSEWSKHAVSNYGSMLLFSTLEKILMDRPQIYRLKDVHIPGKN